MEAELGDEEVSRFFRGAAFALAGVLVAAYLWVAAREWFFGDDLVFLARAQARSSAADWLHVFAPLSPRGWWSYRPLTIDVYYKLLTAAFGLTPFAFLAVNVLTHAATALLLARLAGHLGFGRHAATLAALLALAAYPTSRELFWAAAFQHVGTRFFYLACIVAFLEFQRSGRRRWQLVSCGAAVCGLLGNEVAVTLPLSLWVTSMARSDARWGKRATSAARSMLPQGLIVALFAVFRWGILATPKLDAPFMYVSSFGAHILRNAVGYAWLMAHENAAHAGLIAGIAAFSWSRVLRVAPALASQLGERVLFFAGWGAALVVPFLGLAEAHPRLALIVELPFCLLVAAHIDALRRTYDSDRLRGFERFVLAVVVAAIPLATVRERGLQPIGQINREFAAALATRPPMGRFACVVLRLDPSQEWRWTDRFDVEFRMTGILDALHPGLVQQLFIGRDPLARRRCLEMRLRRTDGSGYRLEVFDMVEVGPAVPNPASRRRGAGRLPSQPRR
jgi:hypothetical protein